MSDAQVAINSPRPPPVLWILRLVPRQRGGRWLCAGMIFGVLMLCFAASDVLPGLTSGQGPWAMALFFALVIAYMIPVYHYIVERTLLAFDAVADAVADRALLGPTELAQMRLRIRCKPLGWQLTVLVISIGIWAFQGWMLSQGNRGLEALSAAAALMMTLAPLLVWITVTTAVLALVDTALMFRSLVPHLRVDLLAPRALNPIGSMAVSSTLVVIGLEALFPVMWLGEAIDPWTTIPGVIVTSGALVFMFLAPVLPLHSVLSKAKAEELTRVQAEIDARRGADGVVPDQECLAELAPWLEYRRELAAVPEWPFDLGMIARFGLYLVVVPMTWIGAALIEILVDLLIDGPPAAG